VIGALVLAAAVAVPPAPTDYVTDTAGALSARAADGIRSELRAYDESTGNRVIVYIAQTTGDTPLEEWTIRAAENWKIFSRGKPDGAILFVFMRDHKIRIEVGYGLEAVLPDAQAFRIIHETIAPKMRAGDVDGAVQSGVDRILLTITPSFKDKMGHRVAQPEAAGDTASTAAYFTIGLIFFLLVIIGWIYSRRGRSAWLWGAGSGAWYGGGWGGSSGGGLSSGGFSGGGGFGGGFGGGGASGGW